MEIYSRRELSRILHGLASANEGAKKAGQSDVSYPQGYHDGFNSALVAFGLSVGLGPFLPQRVDGPTWIEMEIGD